MNARFLRRVTLVFAPLALIATTAIGQTQQKPLDDKDNPLMIGKRNINKGQIDFYSIDKEVALGRQLAAEVDRESKFVTDPIVTEFVNRVGQNIVLHSDVKTPVTIKVIDSNEVNAFALPGGHLYINRAVIETADNEAEMAVPLTFLKFSRGAEEEADRLGAQYMWAAGYDPHAMVTFFEKLQAKEK